MLVHLGIPEIQEIVIPTCEHVKFHQVGSYAVGNRLAKGDYYSFQSDPNRQNTPTSGHRACQGRGEALGARYALDSAAAASGGGIVAVNATDCLEVLSMPYPESAWTFPWSHSLFGNAPAVAVGATTGLAARGKTTRVVARSGNGGTADIGMGCLPDMFERNDDVLYICYDNQVYMNTGVQRSGATSPTAHTAMIQSVGPNPGNRFGQGKDMARIAMVHETPYITTATVVDLCDPEHKVKKVMSYYGARYIHVLVPCLLGWDAAPSIIVKLARLTTQTGLFPAFEAEGGEIASVTKIRRPAPVGEYLCPQRRLAHLFKGGGDAETLARFQAIADRSTRRHGLIDKESPDEDVRARVFSAPEDPEGHYEHILHVVSQTKQGRVEVAALAGAFESRGPMTQIRRPDTVMRAPLRTNAPEQE